MSKWSLFRPVRDAAWLDARDYQEEYRLRATTGPLHAMSARPERLTELINDAVGMRLALSADDVVVDVGCGYGYLLSRFQDRFRSGIGVTSSVEEAARLRTTYAGQTKLEFIDGLVQDLPLPNARADRVICHGVLLILGSHDEARDAIRELARIAKPSALVWIGEVPDTDETKDAHGAPPANPYGRLVGAFARHGLRLPLQALYALARSRERKRLRRARERLAQTRFHCPPSDLIAMARDVGLIPVWHGKHTTYAADETPFPSATRWDYLFKK